MKLDMKRKTVLGYSLADRLAEQQLDEVLGLKQARARDLFSIWPADPNALAVYCNAQGLGGLGYNALDRKYRGGGFSRTAGLKLAKEAARLIDCTWVLMNETTRERTEIVLDGQHED